ncbi:MAG TPA: helix-turn-helix domain-containing protein [Candidatus Dormibacteraeota bacterium]|nr:helix-turn-helix domain-containing protein [Candidatus Dormibacteraeota bacterium]
MTRIANGTRRAYHSQLRAQQAEETRARILDATVRVMAGGLAYVSIPDVAREAGVSVPTIYRHFATKRDLIAAVHPHIVRRAGLDKLVPPRSVDELRGGVRAYIDHVESYDDLARAAMASPASEEARRINMPDRLAAFRRLADSVEPKLAEADRDRIARLLVILTASSALRMWRDNLGLSVDAAADEVDWVVKAAIAAATRRNRQ